LKKKSGTVFKELAKGMTFPDGWIVFRKEGETIRDVSLKSSCPRSQPAVRESEGN